MNILLTSFLNNKVDVQRNIKWEADPKALEPLIKSLKAPLVVLTDCLNEPDNEFVTYIKVKPGINPYFQRWFDYLDYLKETNIDKVFCVDIDVEMLKDPFPHMRERIYVGSEHAKVGSEWMLKHNKGEIKEYIKYNQKRLLNAGLLGGNRPTIIKVLEEFKRLYYKYDAGEIDMGLFNYVLYSEFQDKLSIGEHINTHFGKDQYNDTSWFKHH